MDQRTIERARAGDIAAFDDICRASHARLFRVAFGILRDRATADDATQQALIDIWRRLPRLREAASFRAWSYRILVRACYAEAKRRTEGTSANESAMVEPRAPDPYAGILANDELERAFRRLSTEHRAILALRFLADLPHDEIASTLDLPMGTVGSRLSRATRALRASIEADQRLDEITARAEVSR